MSPVRYQKKVGIFSADLALTENEEVVSIEVPGKGRIWFPAKHLNDLVVIASNMRDFWLNNKKS